MNYSKNEFDELISQTIIKDILPDPGMGFNATVIEKLVIQDELNKFNRNIRYIWMTVISVCLLSILTVVKLILSIKPEKINYFYFTTIWYKATAYISICLNNLHSFIPSFTNCITLIWAGLFICAVFASAVFISLEFE
ncbi:MAG: hypothetical protein A3J83_09035 [Elusimicrobia bacterium RIFOXYA2_FULL_40_6]|nr:MAG: hypothetical protein A3J83_09035 [Elusimicrobia bacterium RIFOXYA2_FULL_40_6]